MNGHELLDTLKKLSAEQLSMTVVILDADEGCYLKVDESLCGVDTPQKVFVLAATYKDRV